MGISCRSRCECSPNNPAAFEGLPPINEEAAKRIKRLEAALEAIIKHQAMVGGGIAGYSTTKLIAERALKD